MAQTTFKDIACSSDLEPLSDQEIEDFFHDIDRDGDGVITFDELEAKLEEVHEEIAPQAQQHHLHHPKRRFAKQQKHQNQQHDLEKGHPPQSAEHDGLHAFLCALMPSCSRSIGKDEFMRHVRSWNIPSLRMTTAEREDAEDNAYLKRMTWYRKLRAHWSVQGPKMVFAGCVFLLSLAFFLWQGLYYQYNQPVRAAVGWGVVMAKFAAGAIYPVLFFTVLSMCRWFSTFMRRFYWVSRFVDWDLSQSFHIWMACIGLFFATLHAIGHLTGTFLTGSRPSRQAALAEILGPEQTPATYSSFVRKLPGWSGIVALGLYWTIALLSLPPVRRWSYELFQLGHLLMFPFLGLLCAHGTAKILQYSMLGFWLAFPFVLVIVERTVRVYRGFSNLPARLDILDSETVCVTIKHPKGKSWRYQAGQYVFLQVPELSFFQWHPFTISSCIDDKLQLHIKTDGDWTGQLRHLPTDIEVHVGIDGPFGAPAQRFYDFDRSLVIGAGVGITPFSAIITDLEQRLSDQKDPWETRSTRSSRAPSRSRASSRHSRSTSLARRRVAFHWTVRDKASLLWFASLLNRAHDLSRTLPRNSLELSLTTHITTTRRNISTHVFRYLLDGYRTPSAPVSALTGLKTRSRFGRPDFESILADFYREEVRRMEAQGTVGEGGKVGVFFCGSPKLGRVISDACAELTARARAEGTKVRFMFMMEVFG